MKKILRFAAGLTFGAILSAGALAFVPPQAEALPPVCGIVTSGCDVCLVCGGSPVSCHENPAGC